MTGLAVHGSSHMIYILDATMTCSALDANGQVGSTTGVYIAGSLTSDGSNPSSAECLGGEQVVSVRTDTGAGLDSLDLFCAPTTCT